MPIYTFECKRVWLDTPSTIHAYEYTRPCLYTPTPLINAYDFTRLRLLTPTTLNVSTTPAYRLPRLRLHTPTCLNAFDYRRLRLRLWLQTRFCLYIYIYLCLSLSLSIYIYIPTTLKRRRPCTPTPICTFDSKRLRLYKLRLYTPMSIHAYPYLRLRLLNA